VLPSDDGLILATHPSYWRYATVAHPGGEIVRQPSRWTRERYDSSIEVAGFAGRVGFNPAATFVSDGVLVVQVGTSACPIDASVTVTHHAGKLVRRLRLARGSETLLDVRYLRPGRSYFHIPDGFEDEGDYDFGAFIARIVSRASGPHSILSLWPFTRELGNLERAMRALRAPGGQRR
jgi:hypothetical protein